MKTVRIFLCFLWVMALPVVQAARAQSDADQFKTGFLKDLTPPSVLPSAVTISDDQPVFFVVGIDHGASIDVRPEAQRDQVRFKLLLGKGQFASMDSPVQKSEGGITVTVGNTDVAPVLFFPSAGATAYQVVAEALTKGDSGSVSFSFSLGAPDKAGFLKAAQWGAKSQEKWKFGDAEVIQKTTIRTFGLDGKSTLPDRVSAQYEKYHGSKIEVRDKDASGKILRTVSLDEAKMEKNSDVSVWTSSWAVGPSDYIFLEKHEPPQMTSYNLFLVNKDKGLLDGLVGLSQLGYSLSENQYVKKGDVYFPLLVKDDSFSYQGKQTGSMESNYQILSPHN